MLRLDEPGQAVAVEADPDAALRGLAEPILIDEWQIVPEVLGAVKRAVDHDSTPGRFIVTGSVRGDIDSPTWPGTGRLLEAYALNTGGITDQRGIYEAAGVSRSTGEAYEQLLRNLLVVDALPAWWTNRIKRLMRGPKRYVVDPSLALAVLRIDAAGLMRDGDLLGRIIDTFVTAQLRAQLAGCDTQPRLFHLRQEKGQHEVDVIVEYGGGRIFAIEIKASSAPRKDDARHLIWLHDELGDRFIGGAVLHTGPRAFMLDDRVAAAPIATLWT